MASSSASSMQKSYQYDVFLSFRGEDTRKNFVDHLYHALQHKNIHTYKDDVRLEKGKRINGELLKSIEESRFCIIVFSKDYASSSWCLDELVKIMECRKTTGLIAYPVFYDVDPSQVRKQSGAVGEAFAKHNEEEVGKWREALKEASNLAGWDVRNTADGHEAKVIQLIVEQILLESRNINSSVDEDLIGMEPRMQDIGSSLDIGLDDVRMIGIKGIGGGGKTTLARALFDKMSIWFEGASFVANVRESSKASGLHSLQKQVLSDVLNDKGISVSSVHDGKNMMKEKLGGKKVLVVLDDVDHISQLEALAGAPNQLKPGSRIIITTRDEQVLVSHRVKWIHDVILLSDDEAILLFSRYAFGTDIPIQGYEKLSREVVRYAAGLPLTIKVLGSFLCGKDELEWIDALERLKTIPLKETMEMLELSYTGLEDDYKEIFLDVACFLKGYTKADAIQMLESCEFHARNGLRVLEQKSLITISDGRLCMHDHLQEMGRNIVRRLHPDEPGKHSRLWIPEEIQDILTNDLGTEATRAITLHISQEMCPEIFARCFGNMKIMKKLRFLAIIPAWWVVVSRRCEKYPVTFPDKLQYLHWADYPRRSLPKTFQANNLVALELPSSRIVHFWEGGERKVLNKLRFLNLSYSLIRILDLGGFPNLESLYLGGCSDLVELQAPVGCLKRLVYLDLMECLKLKSFSFIKHLESLEVLHLTYLRLEKFPDIIPGHSNNSLVELWFGSEKIEELPSSIVHLHKLVCLCLYDCQQLKSLPRSICGLRNLRKLTVSLCEVEELPEDIGHLECLEELHFQSRSIKHLPDSICMLKQLNTLNLSYCYRLEKLPVDLGKLECLEELNFSSNNIKHLPDSICMLKQLNTLDLSYCWRLEKLPVDLGKLECLKNLILTECTLLRDVPDSICRLKRLKHFDLFRCIDLEKLPKDLGLLECLEVLNVKRTRIRKLPQSISLLKGLKIYGPKSVLQS